MTITKKMSIFDLDNTLLDVDSELIWCKVLYSQKIVGDAFINMIHDNYLDYDAGTMEFTQYEKNLLKPIAGYDNSQLKSLIDEFIKMIKLHIRPQLMERVEDHKAQGFTILLATASNNIIAGPVAKLLGIENLVCTMAEMDDGKPTGNLVGLPAFGCEKVLKIQKWIRERKFEISESWGYSDSFNDLPVLHLVQKPVAVSPDNRLQAYALARGWEIIDC